VAKHTNSAFVDTDLEVQLAQGGTRTSRLRCATHNSVEATVRHAGNLGFRVLLPADACWAVDVRDLTGRLWTAEDVHQLSLAVMQGEYATIIETKAVLAALAAIER
jgi:nicotinamidase-related amidase